MKYYQYKDKRAILYACSLFPETFSDAISGTLVTQTLS